MAEFAYEGRDLEAMSFARRYHEWILSRFRPYLGARVAEVGAGSGSFSELLLAEPVEEFVAIEPASGMHAALAAHTAHDARASTRNAFFGDVCAEYAGHFDSIFYVNVLEHVENDARELQHIKESLRPGGYACIFVPALPGLYSAHDASIGHYRRYAKRELRERAEAAGLEIVSLRYFDILGVLPWLVLMTWLGKSPGRSAVSLYDTLVVPFSRSLESLIAPPFGKNLVLVARRRMV